MNTTIARARLRLALKDHIPSVLYPLTLDDCDSPWTPIPPNSATIDTVQKQQGAASAKILITAAHGTGLAAYRDISPLDLTGHAWLRFWARSSLPLAAGDLALVLADAPGPSPPVKSVPLPAMVAEVWHEHQVLLGDTSGLASVAGLGLWVSVNPGEATVWLDNIRSLSSSHRWTDEELDRHLQQALRRLSYHIPREMESELATTPGSRYIDITALGGWSSVFAVEYPAHCEPPAFRRFQLWQDRVFLQEDVVPDGGPCVVRYGRMHELDAEGTSLPEHLEDLVVFGAQGYALQAYAAGALDVVQADARYAQERAFRDGQLLLSSFNDVLQRLSHRARLRPSHMYTTTG